MPQNSKRSDSNSVELNLDKYPFEVEENFKIGKTSTERVLSIDLREGFGWTPDQISQAQKSDEHLFVVLGWIRADTRPPFKKIKKLSIWKTHWQENAFSYWFLKKCVRES
ncbi:unnamed protein product [Clavelina lepadiformis]|uniref:Uncharacterized protein n=1 Tax=Clavelina lepadiformis TaxID=159417 RepID=A0ABP0GL76_CLALP